MSTVADAADGLVVAVLAPLLVPGRALTPRELVRVVRAVAAAPYVWQHAVRHDDEQRHYLRLFASAEVDVWVNTWPDGADTTLHDHGGSGGAYHVVSGLLTEDYVSRGRLRRRMLTPGRTIGFDPRHVHDVGSRDGSPAVSIHAYSRPLSSLHYYRLEAGELAVTSTKQIVQFSSW